MASLGILSLYLPALFFVIENPGHIGRAGLGHKALILAEGAFLTGSP